MRESTASTDADALRTTLYADSANLNDRIAIYAHRTEPLDFHAWVLERLPLRPGLDVLDIGCGPGNYLGRFAAIDGHGRVIGMDLSAGMAREAAAVAGSLVAVGDAGALPLLDGSVDLVLAAHMLYHVPDAPAALREARRVLRPGGTLAAITNGSQHQAELHRALGRLTGRDLWAPVASRWDLDVGLAMLREHFDHVELHRSVGELRVRRPGPVLRYVGSMRGMDDDRLGDREWDDLLGDLERVVADEIARSGAFTITVESGLLLANG
jgi:SAM-dependent methyltransferase